MSPFRLGDKVEDRVTGLVGIAVARIEYLNGCVQWCLQPRVAEDAMKIDSHYIDEGQLRKVSDGINPPRQLLSKLRGMVKRARKERVIEPPRRRRSGGPSVHVPKQMMGPKP